MLKTLGNRLDVGTQETFSLAEQLDTNLTQLNIRIEGSNAVITNHRSLCCVLISVSVHVQR